MKRALFVLSLLSLTLSGRLHGDTVTLPAAASVVGLAPFFSDVRAFNTSYTESLTVTADYRCFIGTCPSGPQTFPLGPRESRAFDDIGVSLFSSPGSAGTVEFSAAGSSLVVTSRLYSTSPIPTVGMFVPGLRASSAHPITVLTSLSNAGDGMGFRTNVGAYNPNGVPVVATFRLYNGAALLGTAARVLPPRTGTQINGIFNAVGASGVPTRNAHCVVESDSTNPLFTYAAVIDNQTTDPIFVVGAEDARQPAGPPPGEVLTLTASGVTPNSATVPLGGSVTFTNNDTVPRQVASDPHPTHTDCPELNGPVLQAGASFTATMRSAPRTCGFHDHLDAGNAAFRGTIRVGP